MLLNIIVQWGNSYITPEQEILNKKILSEFSNHLKYSSIEHSNSERSITWLISSVTKKIWERYPILDINEVVISTNISFENDYIELNADVSLGDGDILFEIETASISNKDVTSDTLNYKFKPLLDTFFSKCYEYFSDGIKVIEMNSTENSKYINL